MSELTNWCSCGGVLRDGVCSERGCYGANAIPAERSWTVNVCRGCGTILGEVRAAIRLKTCPECGRRCVPVEDETDRITVREA